jgi:hypothetical protein
MEELMRYRAFQAFCRQRAQMEGENELFWHTEAELLGKLVTETYRLNALSEAEKIAAELNRDAP